MFECETAADALEVRRGLVNEITPSSRRRKSAGPASRRQEGVTDTPELKERSKRILESLRAVGRDGIQTEALASAVGVTPKSLPPQMMQLRRELKGRGLRFGDVIVRNRVYVQGRAKSMYRPGRAIDEALKGRQT